MSGKHHKPPWWRRRGRGTQQRVSRPRGFVSEMVGLWRMAGALEIGDHERVVAVAEGLNPAVHPNRTRGPCTGLTMAGRWPGCGDDRTMR